MIFGKGETFMVEDMIFRMDYKKLANILEEERKENCNGFRNI